MAKKKVEWTKVSCKECGHEWRLMPSDYRARMKGNKNGGLFCSIKCSTAHRVAKRRMSEHSTT